MEKIEQRAHRTISQLFEPSEVYRQSSNLVIVQILWKKRDKYARRATRRRLQDTNTGHDLETKMVSGGDEQRKRETHKCF